LAALVLREAPAGVDALTLARGHRAGPSLDVQERPLPDADRFLAEARQRLASNGLLQSRFTFRERITDVRLNPFGRMGTGPIEVFEVYPVQGSEMTYRRLVERGGYPLPPAEIREQDRKFLGRYEAWRRQLAREGKNEREARLRKETEAQAKERGQAAEILDLFVFTLAGRDTIAGQPAIIVSFKPKPGARPQSREARIASSFVGRAWLHEDEYQVIQVEAQAFEDAVIGWGVVARLHKGATASLTREKIGDAWLPRRTHFNGDGRALLFRRATFHFTREYSDYRPFDPAQLSAMLAVSTTGSN
jgi:hypothetical protein